MMWINCDCIAIATSFLDTYMLNFILKTKYFYDFFSDLF